MTIIGILGICTMILTLGAVCYVFSDSFLDPKSKSNCIRYYRSGNQRRRSL